MLQMQDIMDLIEGDNDQSMFFLTILEKNKKNEINIFSRMCKSTINNDKLSSNESEINKHTTKQIKICSKKQDRNNIKTLKMNNCYMNYF